MDWFEQSSPLIVPVVPRLALRYFLEAEFANCARAHDPSQQSGPLHRVIRTGRSTMRNVIGSYTSPNKYHRNGEHDRWDKLPQELPSRTILSEHCISRKTLASCLES